MKAVKTSGGGTVGYSPTAAAGGLLGEVGASCGADRPPPVVDRVKSNDNAGVDSSSTRLAQGGLLLQRRSTPDHDSPRFRVPAAASGAGTVAVGSPARVARRMSPFVREVRARPNLPVV